MRQPPRKASVRAVPETTEAQGLGAVGLLDGDRGEEHHDDQRDQDHRDGLELAPQVGPGALLDGLGDLLHLGRALVLLQDAVHEDEADDDGEEGATAGEDQDGPLPRRRA